MKTFTKEEWNAISDERKGKISHAVSYSKQNVRKYRLLGRAAGIASDDFSAIGRLTLKKGRRMLVEGIDFLVDGRNRVSNEFSLT